MIPSTYNFDDSTKKIVAPYKLGDLVLKHEEYITVWKVAALYEDTCYGSGWGVDVEVVNSAPGWGLWPIGHTDHGLCAQWFWPLRHLAGTPPGMNAQNFTGFNPPPTLLYDCLDQNLVVGGVHPTMLAGAATCPTGIVGRVMEEYGGSIRVHPLLSDGRDGDYRSIEGTWYSKSWWWPLRAVPFAGPIKPVRDSRFPHECPNPACRAPAYIGSYATECSRNCGVWVKPAK